MKKGAGFSIVEVLTVVMLIAVLGSIAIPHWRGCVKRPRSTVDELR